MTGSTAIAGNGVSRIGHFGKRLNHFGKRLNDVSPSRLAWLERPISLRTAIRPAMRRRKLLASALRDGWQSDEA
jgi:hypothetical protein